MVEDILARIPIFDGLTPEDREIAARLWQPRRVEEGELLFQRSDPGDSMFLIEEGKLEVMIPAQVGDGEVVVSKLRAGDFVGELALLSGMPRTATARAVVPTRVLEMSRDAFLGFLEKRPNVAISMLQEMGRRLRATNELVMSVTSKNANELLADRLTLGQRVADKVAVFGGSWYFIGAFAFCLFGWIGLNLLQFWFTPFDAYPFIFLNLMLSCLAAIQAPVIMMSQNRAQAKDRIKADLDYQSGVKSELMLQTLHGKLDELAAELRRRRAASDD